MKANFGKTFRKRDELKVAIFISVFFLLLGVFGVCVTPNSSNASSLIGIVAGVILISIPLVIDYFRENPEFWETIE